MTRLLLTSKGEKTVCADRDDRGGVLLTGRDEQQVEINAEMWAQLQGLMGEGDDLKLAELEVAAIREAVRLCDGNYSAAARVLGIGRSTLYRRVAELHVSLGVSPRQSPTAERDARA